MSNELKDHAIELLKTLEHHGPIVPFGDFEVIRKINVDKFLVTTGFLKMQQSKIRALGFEDFKETFVVDPTLTSDTKKDIFTKILKKYNLKHGNVLVIGDDPDAEIKAAAELGIDSVLYDRENLHKQAGATYRVSNYNDLLKTDFLS
jgi:putative hydrolase of the HAD superfamily